MVAFLCGSSAADGRQMRGQVGHRPICAAMPSAQYALRTSNGCRGCQVGQPCRLGAQRSLSSTPCVRHFHGTLHKDPRFRRCPWHRHRSLNDSPKRRRIRQDCPNAGGFSPCNWRDMHWGRRAARRQRSYANSPPRFKKRHQKQLDEKNGQHTWRWSPVPESRGKQVRSGRSRSTVAR